MLAGNGGDGADISNLPGSENVIVGNRIGVNAAGLPLPNQGNGVTIFNANSNRVGGLLAAEANVIANNAAFGIHVYRGTNLVGTVANSILGNALFNNGQLGIELGGPDELVGDGPDVNDVLDTDDGPNGKQNRPNLTNATLAAVSGVLNAAAFTSYRIEVFANTTVDPGGSGEGETFLTATDVLTDAGGAAPVFVSLPALPIGMTNLTATATGPDGTSEFSPAIAITTSPPVVPPRLTGARIATNGDFEFQFTVGAGINFRVEASTNLINWENLGEDVGDGLPVLFSNGDTLLFPIRFFRVMLR